MSLEVLVAPREFDADFGFEPKSEAMHPPLWPMTAVPASTRVPKFGR
jgi:hypothetical protein